MPHKEAEDGCRGMVGGGGERRNRTAVTRWPGVGEGVTWPHPPRPLLSSDALAGSEVISQINCGYNDGDDIDIEVRWIHLLLTTTVVTIRNQGFK